MQNDAKGKIMKVIDRYAVTVKKEGIIVGDVCSYTQLRF